MLEPGCASPSLRTLCRTARQRRLVQQSVYLQTIVDKFRRERCAMVIGSYRMTNFQLETLPPGVIDHKEWTDTNGHNNALRINGLGAPRAFFTPLLRKIRVPNTSYGEDYALGLAFSREYRIGRIYDVLICAVAGKAIPTRP